ncbi:hypothetical protein WEH80_07585 [Actinomycetes bacterium KLBMP 9759]
MIDTITVTLLVFPPQTVTIEAEVTLEDPSRKVTAVRQASGASLIGSPYVDFKRDYSSVPSGTRIGGKVRLHPSEDPFAAPACVDYTR